MEYRTLIMLSLVLGLAPFYPLPHIVEKAEMLFAGTLSRPIDIFDLLFHASPIILLVIKFVSEKHSKAD